MSLLSKALKKAGKFVKKNKKALEIGARVIAAGVTRGKSEKVVSQLKGVGAAVKTYKGLTKKLAKSEVAQIAKTAMKLPRPKIIGISAVQATTMPGGAKLKGVSTGSTSSSATRKAVAVVKPRKKAAAKPKAASKGRKPPKGGLDLKGLSASWKAAGKPGTWQQWIASHK